LFSGKICLLIKSILLLSIITFAQSKESGNAFNKYMAPEAGVNPLSGTLAFSKTLASISSGMLTTTFELQYSGNIFKEIQNRNDVSPGGVVGLGWSLGRAKILSVDAGTAKIDDDSYFLQTASNSRYKIFYDSTTKKWWTEGNPYWKIERIVKTSDLVQSNSTWKDAICQWKFVAGWKIVDENGNTHYYGDIDDSDPLRNPSKNATEYSLFWGKKQNSDGSYSCSYGTVGKALGGVPNYYPVSWNISKEVDIDGKKLVYSYESVNEELAGTFTGNTFWKSKASYTKESYLSKVESDDGSKIEFTYGNKGEGLFAGEFWDSWGMAESIGDDPDAWIERIERKYLKKIKTSGKEGRLLGTIDFCYKPLSITVAGRDLGKAYVKRLLTSIEFFNANGILADYERYGYYEDADKAAITDGQKTVYPLGALYSIKGKECGWVEYGYSYETIAANNENEFNGVKELLADGYLEDGTPYMVTRTSSGVYPWVQLYGKWNKMDEITGLGTQLHVTTGNGGWFSIIDTVTSEKVNLYVYQWNGQLFMQKYKKEYKTFDPDWYNPFEDSFYQTALIGPNYVVWYELDDETGPGLSDGYLKLIIPWSTWGGTYEKKINNIDETYSKVLVLVSQNNILVSYLKGLGMNERAVRIYTIVGDELIETYSDDNDDNDNRFDISDGYFVSAQEASGIGYSKFRASHWDGSDWVLFKSHVFNKDGAYRAVDLQAHGNDFYAARHHDKRYMTDFYWNGEFWETPYKSIQIIKHFGLSSDWVWTGYSGSDFFVTTRPYSEWKWQCHWWGCFYYPKVYANTYVDLFKDVDGQWSHNSLGYLGSHTAEKNIFTGDDLFVINQKDARIWNSLEWKTEALDSAYVKTLLSNSIVRFDNKSNMYVRQKVDDFFTKPIGAYLVTKKTIYEPVSDQKIEYTYSYLFSLNQSTPAFDANNNTPLVQKMTIDLPEMSGFIYQFPCDIGAKRIALGQVCKTETWNDSLTRRMNYSEKTYTRYKESGWPSFVYVDQLTQETAIKNNIKYTTTYNYYSGNGLLKSIKTLNGSSKGNEQVTMYMPELSFFDAETSKRLTPVIGSYTCKPNCATGNVIAANAVKWNDSLDVSHTHFVPQSSWRFNPKTTGVKKKATAIRSEIANIQKGTIPANWTKTSENTVFRGYRVLETEEGDQKIKVSSFVETDSVARVEGSVADCGIEQGLLLSGESCNMTQWSGCDTVNLQGSGVDGIIGIGYGRYSKTAIQVSSSQSLIGTVPNALGKKYRFSAWVQNADGLDRTISVSVAGQHKDWSLSVLKPGAWKYLEWEIDIPAGRTVLSIGTSDASMLRLQDIRFLPYDAAATTLFWDRFWDKNTAKVNDRGLATLVDFDEQGRIDKTFSEKEDGSFYLSSQNEFVDGLCREQTAGMDLLQSMSVNGIPRSLPTIGTVKTVMLSENSFTLKFKTAQTGDNVRYRMYSENGAVPNWSVACCLDAEGLSGSFDRISSWIVQVDVEPMSDSSTYTFKIQKKTSDWIEYGKISAFEKGTMPRFVDGSDSSNILFKAVSGRTLKEVEVGPNLWNSKTIYAGNFSELASVGGTNYDFVAFVPEIMIQDTSDKERPLVLRKNSQGWTQLGNIDISEEATNLKIVVKDNDEAFVIYRDFMPNTNKAVLKSQSWLYGVNTFAALGNLPLFETTSLLFSVSGTDTSATIERGSLTGYAPGRISDNEVEDADIVKGPDNHFFVGYIGTSDYLNINDSIRSPELVIIKRLYNADEVVDGRLVWGGVSNYKQVNAGGVSKLLPEYQGDFVSLGDVSIDGGILDAKKLRLASDGTNLYMAVLYAVMDADSSEKLTLSVWKLQVSETEAGYNQKLIAEPLSDVTFGKIPIRICDLNIEDPFDLEVQNGIPYLMFANKANNERLSVVRYVNGRWLSVGSPAFAKPFGNAISADLAVNSSNKPFVVFKGDSYDSDVARRDKIVPMRYESKGALDLTLSSLGIYVGNTSVGENFRQYILNYSVDVGNADVIKLQASPKTSSDVKTIEIFRKDSLISIWDVTTVTSAPLISIPVDEGKNTIRVFIVGTDNSELTYTVDVVRDFLPKPNFSLVSNTLLPNTVVPASGSGFPDSIQYTLLSSGEVPDSVEIHFNYGWNLLWGDSLYTQPGMIPMDSSIKVSGILVNDKGDSIVVTISPASSSSVTLSDLPWYVNSSSSSGGSTSVDSTIISETLPTDLSLLMYNTILVSGSVRISDQVKIQARNVKASVYVEVGATSSVYGTIFSGGNVFIRSNSWVDSIALKGTLETQAGASYGSLVQLSNFEAVDIPSYEVNYGTANSYIGNDQNISISAGFYGDFSLGSRSSVSFAPGDYYFASFSTEPDVTLTFAKGTRIWVQGTLRFADRVTIVNAGAADDLLFYTNTENSVYVGVGTTMTATLVAPFASVDFSTSVRFNGYVWAANFSVQPQSVIE